MSSWIVSKEHIDLLGTAGLGTPRPPQELRWNESSDICAPPTRGVG
jgi:hypothetical protein